MYEDLIPVLAPDFADDPRMPGAIVIATRQVAVGHCYRDEVIVLLAAHYLAMRDQGWGSSGAVVSESEGGLSRTYAQSKSGEGALGGTGYGREIERLNAMCYGMAATTGWMPS